MHICTHNFRNYFVVLRCSCLHTNVVWVTSLLHGSSISSGLAVIVLLLFMLRSYCCCCFFFSTNQDQTQFNCTHKCCLLLSSSWSTASQIFLLNIITAVSVFEHIYLEFFFLYIYCVALRWYELFSSYGGNGNNVSDWTHNFFVICFSFSSLLFAFS